MQEASVTAFVTQSATVQSSTSSTSAWSDITVNVFKDQHSSRNGLFCSTTTHLQLDSAPPTLWYTHTTKLTSDMAHEHRVSVSHGQNALQNTINWEQSQSCAVLLKLLRITLDCGNSCCTADCTCLSTAKLHLVLQQAGGKGKVVVIVTTKGIAVQRRVC